MEKHIGENEAGEGKPILVSVPTGPLFTPSLNEGCPKCQIPLLFLYQEAGEDVYICPHCHKKWIVSFARDGKTVVNIREVENEPSCNTKIKNKCPVCGEPMECNEAKKEDMVCHKCGKRLYRKEATNVFTGKVDVIYVDRDSGRICSYHNANEQ